MLIVFSGLFLLAACGENDSTQSSEMNIEDIPPPAVIPFTIENIFPHDQKAYTQGLLFYNGKLYEGTGQYGESNVRIVDLESGKVETQVKNSDDVFGEGIAILDGKLYQLTWKNGKVLVYDAETFKKLNEFPLSTDGWGLTTNGQELIVSDGTSFLYFYNPADFNLKHKVNVMDNMGPRVFINELEYINGYVYANLYQSDYIIKINPATGRIEGRADLGSIRNQLGIRPLHLSITSRDPEVLNGIAYDSVNNRIFVTGKYWPKLAEIRLDN